MTLAVDQDRKQYALQVMEERKEAAKGFPRIDNSRLPTDSPFLFYYCKVCGWLSDVKPISWFVAQPRELCSECEGIKAKGWFD